MHNEWRKNEMGNENGPTMFWQLQAEIDFYNESKQGGKAKLQIYEGIDVDENKNSSNSDDEFLPPPKKKAKVKKYQQKHRPMVMAICTPLMARAHENILQAEEMVFIDATSSLDRYNSSVFIVSTSTPTSGIPLGVIISSDETESTIHRGLELMAEVLPDNAFHGRGVAKGPCVVMTDDSHTEREAIHKYWPTAILLLCTFHFLQRRWTWLHDGKNHILKTDQSTLIGKVKELVYTKAEQELERNYCKFLQTPVVKKYPKFSSHMQSLWPRRKEWAHCYRRTTLIRGNHTNNYAEAGMRIMKELIFSRVKAYNLVQMFHFVTETMERYYQSKLLSVANSRLDRFISLRYQGLTAKAYAKDVIQKLSESCFSVPSKTERGVYYYVDMEVSVCTCPRGLDGSPCSHQAAVVLHFGNPSVNCIPALDAEGKKKLAYIAYGKDCVHDASFYSTISQPVLSSFQEQQEPSEIFQHQPQTYISTGWHNRWVAPNSLWLMS